MKDYRCFSLFGPGGIRCSCCNPFPTKGGLKRSKQIVNRYYRRKAKTQLWADLRKEED